MRFDDTVETFKCHTEYEEGAGHTCHPQQGYGYCTVICLTGRHVDIMTIVQISGES